MSIYTHERSGRTTRMLAAAIRAAEAGRRVKIIMATGADTLRIQRIIRGSRVASMIQVVAAGAIHMDWIEMLDMNDPQGAVETFVDHAVIEARFGRVLRALHAWDRDTQAPQQAQPLARVIYVGGPANGIEVPNLDILRAMSTEPPSPIIYRPPFPEPDGLYQYILEEWIVGGEAVAFAVYADRPRSEAIRIISALYPEKTLVEPMATTEPQEMSSPTRATPAPSTRTVPDPAEETPA